MTLVQGIPAHPAFGSYYNSPSINEDAEFPYLDTIPPADEKLEEISSFYETASTEQKPESSFYSTLASQEKPEFSSSESTPVQEKIFSSPYIIKPLKGKTLEKVLAQICDADRIANIANRIYLDYMQLAIEEQKKLVASLSKMMVWEACIITGVGVLEGGAAIGEGFSENISNALLPLGINTSSINVATKCRAASPLLKRGGDAFSTLSRSQQTKLDMVKNNVERIVQGRILEAMSKLSSLSNQYNQSATAILNANTRAQGG